MNWGGGAVPGLRRALLCLGLWAMTVTGCGDGLRDVRQYERGEDGGVVGVDPRHPVTMTETAVREHRDVMLTHLETLDQIVGALAEGNFQLAEMQTHAHAAFFARRMQLVGRPLSAYPPQFQELARVHQAAAETLAGSLSSRDHAKILPALDAVLKACTGCHRAFSVHGDLR